MSHSSWLHRGREHEHVRQEGIELWCVLFQPFEQSSVTPIGDGPPTDLEYNFEDIPLEVRRHLSVVHAAASAYEFAPFGGERYGQLNIAHVATDAVRDIPEAIPTLWKISLYFLLSGASSSHGYPRMRPAVDKHEGVVDAEWRSRTYPDVAVLRLRDTDDGACELVVGWELHPKTQAHVRYQYARAAFGLVGAVAIFVIAADAIALSAILMVLLAVYSAKRARDMLRPAFGAAAAVERVLAIAETVKEGSRGR